VQNEKLIQEELKKMNERIALLNLQDKSTDQKLKQVKAGIVQAH
jgi:hypothetical protein